MFRGLINLRSMANRLANERSLYLKQHANNPVDWFPYGPEAFEKARKERKPVLISIGYSSCHWCHVMARECFENPDIAEQMNKLFVCIKVDREERPDVDKIYMDSMLIFNEGHGGWPLNMFCMSDGRPYYGGTYFPPVKLKGSIRSWPAMLTKMHASYKKNVSELDRHCQELIEVMESHRRIQYKTKREVDKDLMSSATNLILEDFNPNFGGFSIEPKFPPALPIMFLLSARHIAQTLTPSITDEAINVTLECMAKGGIYDQIGGGFARYSTDAYWRIPHFEKMLYDNALLIEVYTQAWTNYKKPIYEAVVAETIAWLKREMQSPSGGFASSLDADTEHEEGLTYVWTPEEIKKVLGEAEGAEFCRVYEITPSGNFHNGTSNPFLLTSDFSVRQSFAAAREKLLEVRQARPQPGKDPKKLVSWNSLLAKALVEAGFYFSKPEWTEMGKGIVDWIWNTCLKDGNRLHSVAYDEEGPKFNGNLDDYAFYTEALLAVSSKVDWICPGMSNEYLERAKSILTGILDHFPDEVDGGFYYTSDDHESLFMRSKSFFDDATPNGNASVVHCLSVICQRIDDERFSAALEGMKQFYSGHAKHFPFAAAYACAGFSEQFRTVVIKVRQAEKVAELQRELADKPWRKIHIIVDEGLSSEILVCKGKTCLPDLENAFTD
mmetsp:Transcript_15476/g.28059  ORF Transcript_15476/g.28059 Transcript_15476/m.28059 type:complete len:668 (+) Transcript_15476:20-2023(+)